MKEGVNKVYLMAELMTEYFQLIDLLLCRQWKMYPKICFLKEDVRAKNLADRYMKWMLRTCILRCVIYPKIIFIGLPPNIGILFMLASASNTFIYSIS